MILEAEKIQNLIDLAEILCEQNDFDEILRLVTQNATSIFKAESASLMMINPQTRHTIKTILRNGRESNDEKLHAIHTHVSGWVLMNKKSFASEDIRSDPRFAKHFFKDAICQTVLAAPLRSDGTFLGTIFILDPETNSASLEGASALLQKFAVIVSPFLRNSQQLLPYFNTSLSENSLLEKYREVGMIGKSKKFVELLQAIEAAANCDVRVMLHGKSGTGKELIARAIHRNGVRSNKPFVAIDCGAIAENLIESELFGHVKGAFTGAGMDRKGLLEEAHNGTLFMDEIASLPLDMQAKLMRVLQEGEVRPVGSNKTRNVDIRVISASSAPLQQLVGEQKFREDLFYRLHVYPIHVPVLNDRRQDIPLLANHFLEKYATQQGKRIDSFHEEVMDFMCQRPWAGNIRELENFVERLIALTPVDARIINRKILPPDLKKELKKFDANHIPQTSFKSLNETLAEYENQVLHQVLAANNWNQARTARHLRIAEQTLRYKMAKLGIERPAK